MVEIIDYDKAGRPVFRIHSYYSNGKLVKIKDFSEITSGLTRSSFISCKLMEKSHKLSAIYNGCYCKIPSESCSNAFKEGTSIGDNIKARILSLETDGNFITVYPLLPSYVQPIEDMEISAFFFEVIGKDYPDRITVRFDNGETGNYVLKNGFYWASLRIGDVYSDFHRSKYDSEELTYNRWQLNKFISEYKVGDLVKGKITYLSRNMCICWAQGVVGRVLNFKNKRVVVGEEYLLSVTNNESNQLAFNLER
jgi:ribosomal protein L21E